MDPLDHLVQRVLAERIHNTEQGNQHLQAELQRHKVMLEEAQKRIADLESAKLDAPAADV